MVSHSMKKQCVLLAALNAVAWFSGATGQESAKRSVKLEAATGNEQIVCTLDLLSATERNDFFMVSKILQFFSDKKNDEKTIAQQLANIDEIIEDKIDKEQNQHSDLTKQEVMNLKKLVRNYYVATVTIGNYSDSAITIPNKGYIREIAQYEVDKKQILNLYPRLSDRSDEYKLRTIIFGCGSALSGVVACALGHTASNKSKNTPGATVLPWWLGTAAFGLSSAALLALCAYRFIGPQQELAALMLGFQSLQFNINNAQLNDVNTNITTYSSGSYGFVIPAQSIFTTVIFLDKTKLFEPRTAGSLTLTYA